MIIWTILLCVVAWWLGLHALVNVILCVWALLFFVNVFVGAGRTFAPLFQGIGLVGAAIAGIFAGLIDLIGHRSDRTPPAQALATRSDDTIVISERVSVLAYLDTFEIDQYAVAGSGSKIRKQIRSFLESPYDFEVFVEGEDALGRQRVQVAINGLDISLSLIHFGFALATPDAPQAYTDAQHDAQLYQRGVWGDSRSFLSMDLPQRFKLD